HYCWLGRSSGQAPTMLCSTAYLWSWSFSAGVPGLWRSLCAGRYGPLCFRPLREKTSDDSRSPTTPASNNDPAVTWHRTAFWSYPESTDHYPLSLILSHTMFFEGRAPGRGSGQWPRITRSAVGERTLGRNVSI